MGGIINIHGLSSTSLTGSIPVTSGGTGLTSLGTAGQVLKVNDAANALEFGGALQSNHVLERLDAIQTMLTLEVDARKKELEERYQKDNQQIFKNLEKMIIPLLKNLMKNPEKEYIYWPNRTDKIQKQIDKILEITRGTDQK